MKYYQLGSCALSHPAAEAVEACPAITFCRNTAIAHLYQQMLKSPQTVVAMASSYVYRLTFFHNPKILILPLYNLLQIAEILAQIVHFPIVEFDCFGRTLFNVEARADIDNDGARVGELA